MILPDGLGPRGRRPPAAVAYLVAVLVVGAVLYRLTGWPQAAQAAFVALLVLARDERRRRG